MFKTTLKLVMAALCLNFGSEVTAQTPKNKPIRLGETLPESFYQATHQAVNPKTGKTTTIQLKEYKNKLIILDFWASWCSPCISSVNKFDSLRRTEFSNQYIAIPVTSESTKQTRIVFDTYKWDMLSIIEDTLLSQYFPHRSIPHQVWIYNNSVIAMPRHVYATAQNIMQTIQGEIPIMANKIQDLKLNPKLPLFTGKNGGVRSLLKTKYARIVPYVPDYQSEPVQYLKTQDSTLLFCINQTLQYLYMQAFKDEIFPPLANDFEAGIVWNISDSLKRRILLRPGYSLVKADLEIDKKSLEWDKKNLYGYALWYPKAIPEKHARQAMQQDLNLLFGKYFGIHAKVINYISKKYAVLRLLGTVQETLAALGAAHATKTVANTAVLWRYENYPISHLHHHLQMALSAVPGINLSIPQLVDSTGIAANSSITFQFPKSMATAGSLDSIQQELKKYRMYLTIEERTVPVLVVSESTDKTLTH